MRTTGRAALAPVYVRTVAARDDPVIGGVRTVLTIHNLAFQGNFDPGELAWIGLGARSLSRRTCSSSGAAAAL